ncbi:chaperone protein dnaJ 11, chloroplastic-like [Magnolia sinica]|uniref:chaperone protein dnaJ 11, chloroplastic-like n=1 Tax=Magnolia sinica TaxID=86752 RepID=UPI002658A86A|nr:chaperone protein dnaJ 11, chloroplastic-like [Magnolia sinica]
MSATFRLPSTVRFSRAHRPISSRPNTTILSVAATVDARRPANLYQILRVKETASPIEIKTAYRTLAKRFHPDVGSDGSDFMEIHDAYATLSDPTARSHYDLSIRAGRRFRLRPDDRLMTRRWETDQCW